MLRSLIGAIAAYGGIVVMLQDAPRVLFDFQHADEFVRAEGVTITEAECISWNMTGIFDHCRIEYESQDGQQSGQLVDWRFGSEPTRRVQLMQWRGDPTVLTTDISLAGVTNRLSFVVTAILGGLFLAFVLAKKVMRRARGY